MPIDPAAAKAAEGRQLKFLANVDPVDMYRCFEGVDPERTLVVIVSKTFTTAETMLNSRTARDWLLKKLRPYLVPLCAHFVVLVLLIVISLPSTCVRSPPTFLSATSLVFRQRTFSASGTGLVDVTGMR